MREKLIIFVGDARSHIARCHFILLRTPCMPNPPIIMGNGITENEKFTAKANGSFVSLHSFFVGLSINLSFYYSFLDLSVNGNWNEAESRVRKRLVSQFLSQMEITGTAKSNYIKTHERAEIVTWEIDNCSFRLAYGATCTWCTVTHIYSFHFHSVSRHMSWTLNDYYLSTFDSYHMTAT